MKMRKEAQVTLEPSVSEDWLKRVVLAGHSPNEFAAWALADIDLQAFLVRFGGGVEGPPKTDPVSTEDPGGGASNVVRSSSAAQTRSLHLREWTRRSFFQFLDVVSSVDGMMPSMALLGAYLRLGAIPSSDGLKAMCGFVEDSVWQQALRVAKQRLTLEARRVDSPPLFPRAKTGTKGHRLHPIEPMLFSWMKEWGQEKHDGGSPEDAFPAPELWGQQISDGA